MPLVLLYMHVTPSKVCNWNHSSYPEIKLTLMDNAGLLIVYPASMCSNMFLSCQMNDPSNCILIETLHRHGFVYVCTYCDDWYVPVSSFKIPFSWHRKSTFLWYSILTLTIVDSEIPRRHQAFLLGLHSVLKILCNPVDSSKPRELISYYIIWMTIS